MPKKGFMSLQKNIIESYIRAEAYPSVKEDGYIHGVPPLRRFN
jgi:hypothetical protein